MKKRSSNFERFFYLCKILSLIQKWIPTQAKDIKYLNSLRATACLKA